MDTDSSASRQTVARTSLALGLLSSAFLLLALLLLANLWGDPPEQLGIPAVDPKLLNLESWRRTYADLVAAKEDLSDYDCYACHERDKPPPLKFDDKHRIVVPKEHGNIAINHGSHDRNNLCYNCHNEQNLETLQVRDGRVVKFDDIPSLCGSCHGPTYRDWEAGAHGRTTGYWDRNRGRAVRLSCANCHDPHSPAIPGLAPAPGPHPLRAGPEGPRPAVHEVPAS